VLAPFLEFVKQATASGAARQSASTTSNTQGSLAGGVVGAASHAATPSVESAPTKNRGKAPTNLLDLKVTGSSSKNAPTRAAAGVPVSFVPKETSGAIPTLVQVVGHGLKPTLATNATSSIAGKKPVYENWYTPEEKAALDCAWMLRRYPEWQVYDKDLAEYHAKRDSLTPADRKTVRRPPKKPDHPRIKPSLGYKQGGLCPPMTLVTTAKRVEKWLLRSHERALAEDKWQCDFVVVPLGQNNVGIEETGIYVNPRNVTEDSRRDPAMLRMWDEAFKSLKSWISQFRRDGSLKWYSPSFYERTKTSTEATAPATPVAGATNSTPEASEATSAPAVTPEHQAYLVKARNRAKERDLDKMTRQVFMACCRKLATYRSGLKAISEPELAKKKKRALEPLILKAAPSEERGQDDDDEFGDPDLLRLQKEGFKPGEEVSHMRYDALSDEHIWAREFLSRECSRAFLNAAEITQQMEDFTFLKKKAKAANKK